MQTFKMSLDTPEEFILYAKQNDAGSRFFKMVLSSGGVAYEPPAGASFTVRYGRTGMPCGWYDTIALEDGTERAAIVQNGSTLTVELAPQLLAVPGENLLCLLIHGAEEYQLGTWNFRLLIDGDPNPDATKRDDYYNISASTLSKVAAMAQALEEHTGSTANPHGVTAAQIGAAPAGYGLGVKAYNLPNIADANDAIDTGWYKIGSSTANAIGASAMLRVEARENGYIKQTEIRASTGAERTRACVGGVWGEWEWVNPPLLPGVEYRTTERWNGKVVYVKSVSIGAFPNKTTKLVAHGSSATQIIHCAGQDTAAGSSLPREGEGTDILIYSTITDVVISTNYNFSNRDGFVQIWYTKD